MSNAQYLASLVNSSGNINIPVSNAGVVFNNSSATVNSTLNDYETGNWTPTQGGGLTVVGSFSSSGTYTKVGNMVYFTGKVSGSTSIALAAGATISSLPFAVLSTGPNISLVGGICNNAGTTEIAIYLSGTGVAALYGSISTTSSIFFSGSYQATF